MKDPVGHLRIPAGFFMPAMWRRRGQIPVRPTGDA
jgi:hypothetical protein